MQNLLSDIFDAKPPVPQRPMKPLLYVLWSAVLLVLVFMAAHIGTETGVKHALKEGQFDPFINVTCPCDNPNKPLTEEEFKRLQDYLKMQKAVTPKPPDAPEIRKPIGSSDA